MAQNLLARVTKADPTARRRPTVSVIIPNFNHARFVGRAIESVLAQGDDVFEIIVIDDASTDDSVATIESALIGHRHAKLIRNSINCGVIKTLNRGIYQAEGDFLLLGAADDIYLPGMVAASLRAIEAYPDAGFVCGNPILEGVDGSRLQVTMPFGDVVRRVTPDELTTKALQQNILFFTGAALLRRTAVLEAGGLAPDLQWHADWLLDFVLALRHGFCHLPQDCCVVRTAPHTYSQGRRNWTQQRRILRNIISDLSQNYRDVLPLFRRCAMLPTYNAAFAWTLLIDPELRFYATPLLLWRLIAYWPLQKASKVLMPWTLRQRLRGLLRV